VFQGVAGEIDGGLLGDAKQVIVVHTGGIFGLFPHRAALAP
jgi:1-aminocyclopropane-1-carboxylate deaminase/D-cysteine desulfhydrase-like pyridoxal-dependent ACC family enzyme